MPNGWWGQGSQSSSKQTGESLDVATYGGGTCLVLRGVAVLVGPAAGPCRSTDATTREFGTVCTALVWQAIAEG